MKQDEVFKKLGKANQLLQELVCKLNDLWTGKKNYGEISGAKAYAYIDKIYELIHDTEVEEYLNERAKTKN